MGLRLGISDTEHAPPLALFVGEVVEDGPGVYGVLAHQISRIVDAEIEPCAAFHLVAYRRVKASSRNSLCQCLYGGVGYRVAEGVELSRRRRPRCGNLPRDEDVERLVAKRHWTAPAAVLVSYH